jgi:phosphate transport system protein
MKQRHLDQHFDQALAHVRALVDTMSARAESTLGETLWALRERNSDKARELVASDREMNLLELAIDDACIKLLACWQPAASDLRFVAAVLKLTVDLERIGDHCVNICERVLELNGAPGTATPVDLMALGQAVRGLVHDAFVALRAEDVQLASQIIERARQADALVRDVLQCCFQWLARPGTDVGLAIRSYEIAGYLQRIGAHATNVAEMVVFLVRGEDIRHSDRPASRALPVALLDPLPGHPRRGH